MNEETKQQIIIAAATMTGPVESTEDWAQKLLSNVGDLTAMLSPESAQSKLIDSIGQSKTFLATILGIKKEASSTRGVVTLKTKVDPEHSPDGTEEARTERTDNETGVAMARRIRALKFHKVRVWIDVQAMSSGNRKVRVVSHVEDLGVDPDYADKVGVVAAA